MACGDHGGDLATALAEGAFRDAITCAYIGDVGPLVWPMIVLGVPLLGIFIRTRSPIIPAVFVLLFAPIFVANQPAGAARIVMVLLLFGIPAVGLLLYYRIKSTRP